ncbi:MAG TPA: HNH endonuclease signature motif containing protein [Stenotrophomonas sp.]|nr:HNH endonuclease signature motif containing protein [Stenotrophomonas sp.]
MARLKALGSRLGTLPASLPSTSSIAPNYGQGRGGRPWRRLRDSILQRDQHLCQPCKAQGRYTEATQVDHIVPQAEGGTDDRVNLQAICDDCHKRKTEAEALRARGLTPRVAIGEDGWPLRWGGIEKIHR